MSHINHNDKIRFNFIVSPSKYRANEMQLVGYLTKVQIAYKYLSSYSNDFYECKVTR